MGQYLAQRCDVGALHLRTLKDADPVSRCRTSNPRSFLRPPSRYLVQPETWSQCHQPLHIVEWNVTLLCVLLGLATLEFVICLLQLGNGLVNAVCRPCCYKQEYSLNA